MRKLLWFLVTVGILYYGYVYYVAPLLPGDPVGEFWHRIKDYIGGFVGPTSLG